MSQQKHSSQADILGIDPSYRRTGLCLRTESGFVFERIDYDGQLVKDFRNLYSRTLHVAAGVRSIIDKYRPTTVVLESPPPVGQFAGGMYLICGIVAHTLKDYDPLRILIAQPQMGRVLYKNKKWRKSDSVQIAHLITGKKVSGDEADALIMLLPILPPSIQQKAEILRTYEYKELENLDWPSQENQESLEISPPQLLL